jgi:hypothetical protein
MKVSRTGTEITRFQWVVIALGLWAIPSGFLRASGRPRVNRLYSHRNRRIVGPRMAAKRPSCGKSRPAFVVGEKSPFH